MNATTHKPLPHDRFRIAGFLVDPKLNRVSGPDGETSLQPMIMDVLCLLAERHGDVLSRAELIDRVWGVEHGGDESLTRAISQLRKLFGDERGEPRVIETIAKRGYRLIAVPSPADTGTAAARPRRKWVIVSVLGLGIVLIALAALVFRTRTDPTQAVEQRSERTGILLVVDPFTSEAGAPTADGLDEALSTAIARSPLVRTLTRDAAPRRSEAMQYVLRGTIRRVGERVRVGAQIVDSTTGVIVWGEGYERPFDAQFAAQDSVVSAISRESLLPLLRTVKSRLLERPALSLTPWEAILIVTWIPGGEGRPAGPPTEDSYWLQRRALELDPDFAPAHALFAQLASYHALYHPPADARWARIRSQRHAERAIELAPFDAEVLYQVALYHLNSGNRDRAEAMLERVVQLQPDHPLAMIDLPFVRGQCSADAGEAIGQLRALEREMSPSNPVRWVVLARLSALHLSQGDFADARAAARQARSIVPQTWTAMPLAAADAELGLNGEAAEAIAEHRREWPNMDLRFFAERIVPRWCLHGPATARVQASFRKLAASVAPVPQTS